VFALGKKRWATPATGSGWSTAQASWHNESPMRARAYSIRMKLSRQD